MHRYVKYYFKLRAVAETVRSVLPQELLEKSGAARLEVCVLSGESENAKWRVQGIRNASIALTTRQQRSVQERDALLREVARKSKSVTLEQRKVRSPLVLS